MPINEADGPDPRQSQANDKRGIPAFNLARNEKREILTFQLKAEDLIESILRPRIAPGSTSKNNPLVCMFDNAGGSTSACVPMERAEGSPEYVVNVNIQDDPLKQKETNTFYVWNPKTKSEFYKITLHSDPLHRLPPLKSPSLTPVRIRARRP
ncbi:MAG: hypothetical protein HYZ71_13990 [Deltaproteobacteria bacterium]|nr:hypothetical protein [Deltaproteobacteria bacterium]